MGTRHDAQALCTFSQRIHRSRKRLSCDRCGEDVGSSPLRTTDVQPGIRVASHTNTSLRSSGALIVDLPDMTIGRFARWF